MYAYDEPPPKTGLLANSEEQRRERNERSVLHKVCSFLHLPTSKPWASAPRALKQLFGRPNVDWRLVQQYANGQTDWPGQELVDSLDPYTGCVLELLVVIYKNPEVMEKLVTGQ